MEWAKQKTISATVADADSGVTAAWYSTSGTDSSAGKVAMSRTSGTAASGTWTSPAITVPQTYYIWAADGAGNTTTSGVAVVVDKIETTAPVISNAAQNPAEWAKEKTISATVTDAAGGSGVAEVWYTPSGTDSATGKVVMPLTSGSLYTSPSIILPQTYYIWAKDNAGNTTASGMAVVVDKIDTTAPTVTDVAAKRYSATDLRPIATVVDLKSGVASVFASQAATAPPAEGRLEMAKVGATDVYEAAAGIEMTSAWYVYAVDVVGNISDAGIKIEKTIDPEPGTMTKDAQGRWQVQSGEDMQAIGTGQYLMTDSYIVVCNITITNPTWTPIGNTATPFAGIFDGGGFTIDAKNVPATSWQTVALGGKESGVGVGLFGQIDGGTVKNITLNNMTADVTASAGRLCVGTV
ncbi:MAG: hypothetical protein RRY10_07615, partial [Christensenellaceae bacterium]